MLSEYEKRAEAFREEVIREHYLVGAGLKEQMVLVPIYQRYADLFTRPQVQALLSQELEYMSRRNAFLIAAVLVIAVLLFVGYRQLMAAREPADLALETGARIHEQEKRFSDRGGAGDCRVALRRLPATHGRQGTGRSGPGDGHGAAGDHSSHGQRCGQH
jgi:hypothetical protein